MSDTAALAPRGRGRGGSRGGRGRGSAAAAVGGTAVVASEGDLPVLQPATRGKSRGRARGTATAARGGSRGRGRGRGLATTAAARRGASSGDNAATDDPDDQGNDEDDGTVVEPHNWVACDRCGKWRSVPPEIDVDRLTASAWYCEQQTWDAAASVGGCSLREESWEDPEASVAALPSPPAFAPPAMSGADVPLASPTAYAAAAEASTAAAPGSATAAAAASAPPPSRAGITLEIDEDAAGDTGAGKSTGSKKRPRAEAPASATSAGGGSGTASKKRAIASVSAAAGSAQGSQRRNAAGRPVAVAVAPPASPTDEEVPEEAEWVQCEAPGCGKWRRLPAHIHVEDLPSGGWECSMNSWDPERARCDAPADMAEPDEVTTELRGVAAAAASSEAASAAVTTGRGEGVADGGLELDDGAMDDAAAAGGGTAEADIDAAAPTTKQESHLQTGVAAGAESGISLDVETGGQVPQVAYAALVSPTAAPATGGKKKAARRGESAMLGAVLQPQASAAGGGGRIGSGGGGASGSYGAAGAGGGWGAPTSRASSGGGRAAAAAYAPLPSLPAAEPQPDRKGMLPPSYVHGARDSQAQMLLHPPEAWGDPTAAGGVAADLVRGGWATALAVGAGAVAPPLPTGSGTSGGSKLAYRDLVATAWGSKAKLAAASDRSHAAVESNLRWTRSSAYAAPDAPPGGSAPPSRVTVLRGGRGASALGPLPRALGGVEPVPYANECELLQPPAPVPVAGSCTAGSTSAQPSCVVLQQGTARAWSVYGADADSLRRAPPLTRLAAVYLLASLWEECGDSSVAVPNPETVTAALLGARPAGGAAALPPIEAARPATAPSSLLARVADVVAPALPLTTISGVPVAAIGEPSTRARGVVTREWTGPGGHPLVVTGAAVSMLDVVVATVAGETSGASSLASSVMCEAIIAPLRAAIEEEAEAHWSAAAKQAAAAAVLLAPAIAASSAAAAADVAREVVSATPPALGAAEGNASSETAGGTTTLAAPTAQAVAAELTEVSSTTANPADHIPHEAPLVRHVAQPYSELLSADGSEHFIVSGNRARITGGDPSALYAPPYAAHTAVALHERIALPGALLPLLAVAVAAQQIGTVALTEKERATPAPWRPALDRLFALRGRGGSDVAVAANAPMLTAATLSAVALAMLGTANADSTGGRHTAWLANSTQGYGPLATQQRLLLLSSYGLLDHVPHDGKLVLTSTTRDVLAARQGAFRLSQSGAASIASALSRLKHASAAEADGSATCTGASGLSALAADDSVDDSTLVLAAEAARAACAGTIPAAILPLHLAKPWRA